MAAPPQDLGHQRVQAQRVAQNDGCLAGARAVGRENGSEFGWIQK